MPAGFRLGDNDSRILAVALNYSAEGRDVVRRGDLPMRVKAAAMGLEAQEYCKAGGRFRLDRPDQPSTLRPRWWTSYMRPGSVRLPEADEIIVNSGVVLRSPTSAALGRRLPDGRIRRCAPTSRRLGSAGRSAEQRVALDLLLDPDVGIVSLGGRAGTGKSALALCAALELVMERHLFSKVMVFRPIYAVGGQDLGFLPGTEGEKMSPSGQAWSTTPSVRSPTST